MTQGLMVPQLPAQNGLPSATTEATESEASPAGFAPHASVAASYSSCIKGSTGAATIIPENALHHSKPVLEMFMQKIQELEHHVQLDVRHQFQKFTEHFANQECQSIAMTTVPIQDDELATGAKATGAKATICLEIPGMPAYSFASPRSPRMPADSFTSPRSPVPNSRLRSRRSRRKSSVGSQKEKDAIVTQASAETETPWSETGSRLKQRRNSLGSNPTNDVLAQAIASARAEKNDANDKLLSTMQASGQRLRRRLSESTSFDSIPHRCKALVKHPSFDYFIGFFLLANAILIGIQVDVMAKKDDDTPLLHFRLMDWFFCVFFTSELSCRLFAFGLQLYRGKNWQWAVFDTVVVGFQIIDEVTLLLLSATSMADVIGNFGVLRMLRLVRLLRLMRMVHLFPELKGMVCLIVASMQSFFWTLMLLVLLMFCVAVYFTEAAGGLAREWRNDGSIEQVDEIIGAWGSITRSMLSLFQAITGGDDWANFTTVFGDGAPYVMNTFLFSVYIAFATLVMLNLVTGVFVEGAARILQQDKTAEVVKRIVQLFPQIDLDGNREITWEEFQSELGNPGMQMYFQELDLDQNHAAELFNLLDIDNSGSLSIEEFVLGCTRLKGFARSIDLSSLMHDLHLFSMDIEDQFYGIHQSLASLSGIHRSLASSQAASSCPSPLPRRQGPSLASLHQGTSLPLATPSDLQGELAAPPPPSPSAPPPPPSFPPPPPSHPPPPHLCTLPPPPGTPLDALDSTAKVPSLECTAREAAGDAASSTVLPCLPNSVD